MEWDTKWNDRGNESSFEKGDVYLCRGIVLHPLVSNISQITFPPIPSHPQTSFMGAISVFSDSNKCMCALGVL